MNSFKYSFNQPNLRSFVGVRDYTFMLLLLETGIRVSELEGVCVQDILWNESKLHIRNKRRIKSGRAYSNKDEKSNTEVYPNTWSKWKQTLCLLRLMARKCLKGNSRTE